MENKHEDNLLPNFTDTLTRIGSAVQRFANWYQENEDDILKASEAFRLQPSLFHKAAEMGWFIPGSTPVGVFSVIMDGQEALDDFMATNLLSNWEALTIELLNHYPERRKLIEEALNLHKEGRYVASIPLLFSQADGIFNEIFGTYLFTDKRERKQKIKEMMQELNNGSIGEPRISVSESIQDFEASHLNIKLALLFFKNPMESRISEGVQTRDIAPNRSGILHGDKSHLDYGTKINSLKCFSLLAFISQIRKFVPLEDKRKTPEESGQNAEST